MEVILFKYSSIFIIKLLHLQSHILGFEIESSLDI